QVVSYPEGQSFLRRSFLSSGRPLLYSRRSISAMHSSIRSLVASFRALAATRNWPGVYLRLMACFSRRGSAYRPNSWRNNARPRRIEPSTAWGSSGHRFLVAIKTLPSVSSPCLFQTDFNAETAAIVDVDLYSATE